MALSTQIKNLQEITHEELASPSDISPQFAGEWYINNCGQLNSLLGTSFSGVANSGVTPTLDEDAFSIYKLLFFDYYYKRLIKGNLGANAYETWVQITEGDSSIRRVSRTEVSKNLLSLQKTARQELTYLSQEYRLKQAAPVQSVNSGEWAVVVYS